MQNYWNNLIQILHNTIPERFLVPAKKIRLLYYQQLLSVFEEKKTIIINVLQLGIFPDSTHSHWLLSGHTTSNNGTGSCQNLWEGNYAKSVTLEGNRALLPVNADQYTALLWHKLKYSSLYITCNTIYESPLWNFPCCFGSTFTGLKNCRRMLNKWMVIITSTSHYTPDWEHKYS